jgi:hypothetical protein
MSGATGQQRTPRQGARPSSAPGVIAVVWFGCVLLATSVAAQGQRDWKTGPQLQAALRQPMGLAWTGVPLGEYLQQLADRQAVAIWLDRRIDPDQRIDFQASDTELARVLQGVAQEAGAQATLIDSVVYIGPGSTAARLPALAAARRDELAGVPLANRRRLLRRRPWHWDALAVPAELIVQLAEQGGVEVDGLEMVPHDLWAAADLPPLAWIDRLSLLLAGFELTFTVQDNGRRVVLMPMPDDPPVGAKQSSGLEQLAGRAAAPAGGRERRSDKVYSLKVQQQPVQALLQALERQAQLTFVVAAEARERLQQRVTFEVRQVELDQLLGEILEPAGLQFQRQGARVKVFVP